MHERFERWVRDHHAAVYRSAWRIVRDADDARDVTQEVFLQALRRPDEIARALSPERLLRWLAVKTALSHRRGDRNRRRREEEAAMQRPETPEPERHEQRELAEAVRRCVAELPDELRVATTLRFQEELTFAQVGECLGIAEPTAFDRVKKAIGKLRVRLGQLGHAGALGGLEASLAAPEEIAVPAGLASRLLAIPGSAAAAATGAGAVAAAAATSFAGKLLIAGAALALVAGGGFLALQAGGAHGDAGPAAPAAAAVQPVRGESAPSAPERATDARREPVVVNDRRGIALGVLAGAILDEDGRAIPGARVEARSFEGADKGRHWSGEATTDAAGAFRLELAVVVEGGQRYALQIAHVDFVPHVTAPVVVRAAETTELDPVAIRRNRADRAGDYELAIVVQDPAGLPVPGAIVGVSRVVESLDGGDGEGLAGAWEAGGVTDASGSVRLAGSRIGRKTLRIDASRRGWRPLRRPIELVWTGFQELRFTLEPGLSIAGRLVFPQGCDAAKESLGEELPLAELERDGFPPLFDPGGGTVRRPGASVFATGPGLSEPVHAELAFDGSFRIVGLEPGVCTLHVRSRFSPAALFDVEAGREDLVITLKHVDDDSDVGDHLGEIHGRLVEASTGAAVVARWNAVDVEAVDPDVSEQELREDLLAALVHPRMAQVAFDASFRPPPPSDRFHATGLDQGSYVLVARAPGRAPGFSRRVALGRRELVRDVVIELPRPARVVGIVVDGDGRPLAGAVVFATGLGPRSRATVAAMDESVRTGGALAGGFLAGAARTDARGRFELAGLPSLIGLAVAAVHRSHAPGSTAALPLEEGGTVDAGALRLAPRR